MSITIAYIGNEEVEHSQAPSISANLFDFDVMLRHMHKSMLSEAHCESSNAELHVMKIDIGAISRV